MLVEAHSATGKTISACISAVQLLDSSIKTCQALILTPSFNLAQQIQDFVAAIGQSKQISCSVSAGRVPLDANIRALRNDQQFVVGTPGRVSDLIRLGAITINSIRLFVLDEADEMFSRGFTEHVLAIHRLLPASTQSVFLSTTTSQDMRDMATLLLREPLHIALRKRNELPLNGTKQFYIAVEKEDEKLNVICNLSEVYSATQMVMFCNKRKTVEWLASQLTGRGLAASAMHADMAATERATILAAFRSGSVRILLATNMLARGINEPAFLVANYDLPIKHEEYYCRTNSHSGSGREAVTINLTTTAYVGEIHAIENYYSTHIEETSVALLTRSRA